MKIDLATILKELGLPAGLLLLFTAILGLIGVPLDAILTIVEGLVGTFVLIALAINVMKWAGVVNDGTAGKWSAVLNLVVIITVTIIYKLYPTFDFTGVDAQIGAFANVAMVIFAYIIQIVGTKSAHLTMTRGLRLPVFSNTLSKAL